MSEKFVNNEAAVQIAEEAFRAGFKAGWGTAKADRIYSIEQEEHEAWDDFQPSEDMKELTRG